MTNKRSPTKSHKPMQLEIVGKKGESESKAHARGSLEPTVQAGVTIYDCYNKGKLGGIELQELVNVLSDQTKAVHAGNLERSEEMLVAQTHILDAIFNLLTQRAVQNISHYPATVEKYLRLALKAQSQCRTTWEAISAIKNPPMMGYVKQANIAHGPQQVNNGAVSVNRDTHPQENENAQNKLLEKKHGERLDTGAASKTGSHDPELATLGEINRPKNDTGKTKSLQ